MSEHGSAKALRRGDPEGGPRSTHRKRAVGGSRLRVVEQDVERNTRAGDSSEFVSAAPSTAREKVRRFCLEQIRERELEGHAQAPLAYDWVARELGLGKTTVIRAMTTLHRCGEVVATGGFSSRKRIRYWARGDGNPHTWPPAKPGPVNLPGSREANGGDLLLVALERARGGNRNETGLWLACQLRDTGRTIELAAIHMALYADLVPQPPDRKPYTRREAGASLEQAYRREPRPPFRVPAR